MEEYKPEPFLPPFPGAFDPRADVYEVVERLASGELRVASSSWQIWNVPPAQLAPGLELAPGDRALGMLGAVPPVHFWNKLLGRDRAVLRLEPLRPNRTELAFAQRWLGSLIDAELRIEGLDLASLLVERLRTLPFGSRPITPLRQLLRDVLEALVGRFPPGEEREGVDDAIESLRALLAELGVPAFTPPVLPRIEHGWPLIPLLVDAANQALETSASPLRLVPCEQEVFPASLGGEADWDATERPVWLVLAPHAMPALEAAQVLRRYRGAAFPASTGAADPRVLTLRLSLPALVSRDDARRSPTASSLPAAPPPRTAAASSGPPKVPCRATIHSYVPMDATGELVTGDGVLVRFGATACKGFEPTAGMAVWLVAVAPHPLRIGYRATVINLTGQLEKTRLEDAKEANRRKRAEGERERKLLLRHRLIEIRDDENEDGDDGYDWTKVIAQSAAARRAIAADLVELKRTSHLFDELFEDLVTIDAEAFHPHLAALDWRTEPESLAWTRAPFEALAFAEAALAEHGGGALRAEAPIGAHGLAHEMLRIERAPADDAGAAMLALARSAAPEAIRLLNRWLSASGIPEDEANDLLVIAGWQLHDGRLGRLWGHRPAFCVRRSPDGATHLFEASDRQCAICGGPLLCLLRDSTAQIVPFPVFTCARCVVSSGEPYHVEVDAAGAPTLLVDPDRCDEPPLIEPRRLPVAVAVTLEPAPWAVPADPREFERVTRVGGWPSWMQFPRSAGACPTCHAPMEFLAQFPDPAADLWEDERWSGNRDGMIYVFLCRGCRVAASFHQDH